MAKEILPSIKVVFGGHHVSALKEKTLFDFPVIDFTVVGEGEESLSELIEHEGEDLSGVRGMTCRDGSGEVHFTGYRAGIDLDQLPFPAYEKLDGYPDAYKLPIFNYPRTPNTSCIASRGCPYACSYCDRSVFLRTFRYQSAGYLYEHLRYLNERFGLRHINFYDDQFTFNRKRIEEFTTLMADRPLGMTFNCAVRAEHVDSELLARMREAGCWMISLGIESGDEALLSRHRQGADLELLREKIYLIDKAGIRVKGLMMMGLPGETEASIKKSMDFVFSLPIDDINVSKFTPFPGSPLYEGIRDLGTFEEDWEKMDCMHFVFVPKSMTKARLERLFLAFYRRHLLRPKVLFDYFSMLWRSPDSWVRFLSDLPHFIRFALTDRRRWKGESVSRPVNAAAATSVKPLIVIPVYNHSRTLREVVLRALPVHPHVMVVDDGSTDDGLAMIKDLNVRIVRHDKNRGKGSAIMSAAREARDLGMTHLITIDADGQHDPAEVPVFLEKIEKEPLAIVVGKRDFAGRAVPFSSRFGRRFSNFWLRVQTGRSLEDTQSGFRAYPIEILEWLKLHEKRFSFEIEVLVKAAWAGIELKEVDVSVHYAGGLERISHFHPLRDNLILTLLNTRLTIRALLPIPHRRFMPVTAPSEKITILHPLRSLRVLAGRNSSARQLALSSGLGIFVGSLPLIGLQTLMVLATANFLRLNRIAALAASQLCMPPLVPALCIEIGYFIRHGRFLTEISLETIGHQALQRVYEWIIGSLILGPILAVATGLVIYVAASLLRKERRRAA